MVSAAANSSTPSSSSSPRDVSENQIGSPTAAQSRRPSRQITPPWNQIVRDESEPTISAASQSKAPIESTASSSVVAPPPSSSSPLTVEAAVPVGEKSEGKRPVWKRPSNGSSSSEVGPVMGASSWPALSETTKAPSNKSSSDSLKSLGDVPSSSSSSSSVPVSQGTTHAYVPAPKQAGRANHNPTSSQSRQRSFNKRNGASGSTANGTVSQPSSAQGSFAETPLHHNNPSPRGQNQRNGFASQPHGGGAAADNNNQPQRDSYRNQNGNHHQNHGRRNQEHGNQNWNFNRSFNGREGNAQPPQRGPPSFVRHAPPPVQPIPPQFIPAQPIPPPFGSPVPFPPELAAPYYPRMPFIGPLSPAPVFYHFQDAPLSVKLQKQIHYYFSEENLSKDPYLRGQMDDQGFVPLHVIAGFKKVKELTVSIPQIAEALQGSPVVEVQGERVRKRYNWQHWLPFKGMSPVVSSPQSVDAVASRVGNLSLGQGSTDPIGGGGSSSQQPSSSGGVDPVSSRND